MKTKNKIFSDVTYKFKINVCRGVYVCVFLIKGVAVVTF